jgi:hypothetical protein
MTPEQQRDVEVLMARLQDDDIQRALEAGYERDLTNSILEQWLDRKWISVEGRNGKRSQLDLIRDVVDRCEDRLSRRTRTAGSSRRYEGWHGSRD